jgi:hypothetical protein
MTIIETIIDAIFAVLSARGFHQGFVGALFAVVSVPFIRNSPIAKCILGARRGKERNILIALYIASGTLAGYICGQMFTQWPDQTLFLPGISFLMFGKLFGSQGPGDGPSIE